MLTIGTVIGYQDIHLFMWIDDDYVPILFTSTETHNKYMVQDIEGTIHWVSIPKGYYSFEFVDKFDVVHNIPSYDDVFAWMKENELI